MNLTEIKQVYPEFKFWKGIYTTLNRADEMLIYPSDKDNTVKVIFNSSQFYKFFGEIYGDTEFIKWVKSGHIIKMNLTELKEIKSTLKKNCVSIETTDNYFKYTYNTDPTITNKIFYDISDSGVVKHIIEQIEKYTINNNQVILGNIPETSTIIKLYLQEDGIITEASVGNEKLLEIPRAKVLALDPPGEQHETIINYTAMDKNGHRLVSVSCTSEKLKLTQVFMTI